MRRLINSTRTLLALLLLFIGGVTGVSAQTEQTATFDFSTADGIAKMKKADGSAMTTGQLGEDPYTQDGFTLTFVDENSTKNQRHTNGHIRIYKNSYMTIAAPDGCEITKVAITFASTSNWDFSMEEEGSIETSTADKSKTWTATNAVSLVTLKATAQIRITTITVTYEASSGLPSAGLKFSSTAYTVPQGTTSIDEPSLTYSDGFDGIVVYASDNESVATVNSSTGDVTLTGGMGTATITASSEETSNFAAGSASYTIAVLPVYENLAALRAAITATSADFYVTLTDAVVTWVNGSTAYLEDATAGIAYYKSGQSLEQGDVLNGTVKVSGLFYNNQFDELTDIDGATITTGGTIPVTEVTIAELIASENLDKYESRRVKIVGAEVTSALSNNNATLTQNGSDLTVYCTLTSETLNDVNNVVDAIGYLYTYNSNPSFRLFEDPTLNENSKTPSGLAFSAETATANLGESFTAPTLTYDTDATITYSSSEPTVATVDASTGAVTIVAAGTTVITATSPENDTYLAGEASYTLTVVDPNAVYIYKQVTSAEDIVDGGIYLVAGYDKDDNMYLMGVQSGSYRTQVEAASAVTTLSGGLIQANAALVNVSGSPYEMTLVESSTAGTYSLKVLNADNEEVYLAHNSSSNNVVETTSGSNGSLWTLLYNSEDGSVEVKNTTQYSSTDWFFQYNSSNDRFATYKNTMKDPILFRRVETGELTIGTEEGYGTFYNDEPIVLPEGLTATTVTGVTDTDGKLVTAWEYNAGDEVPANTGLLLKGEKGTYTYAILLSTTAATPETNYLRGSVEAETTTGGSVYYKLTYNSTEGEKVLGFYWGAEGGGAFTNAAHKAYLALPASLAAQFKGFAFGEDTATGISAVEQDSNEAAAIYTLGGVRLNSSLKALPKGVYIVNGKKVIK